MDIEMDTNELIQLMDRVDVDRSNEISIDEFSKMTALKLHLLAQGLAEAKNTSIVAKAPKPKLNRTAMSEIWRRVSTRTSHAAPDHPGTHWHAVREMMMLRASCSMSYR